MVALENHVLVRKVQSGDKQAFDELVVKYQAKAINIAYHLIGNYEEAKDVAQEAFVRAYRFIKSFRFESSFSTWFFRILTNMAKNRLRYLARRKWLGTLSLNTPTQTKNGEISRAVSNSSLSPNHLAEKAEIKKRIHEAVDTLKPNHRMVVVLYDIEGLSYEEIARVLEINIGTVKSKLHRARMILREKLKDVI